MSSFQNGGHPLPSPPVAQQDYTQQRPQYPPQQSRPPPQPTALRQRSKSSFSFRSDNSHKSNGSAGKVELVESPKEKRARRLSTKADPRLAMSEAEPSAVAANVASALAPLRAIQHKDTNGQLIADPDRSNPTRSRWERPLDTIRSFEAAIDGNYNTRTSYRRSESAESIAGAGRRSSYYGSTTGTMTPRFPQDTSYSRNSRYDSYLDRSNGMMRPDSYHEQNGGPSNTYNPGRARQMYPRTTSEPMLNNGSSIYPPNGNPRSYETVTTASGSGSSGEPVGYATDPSSESSSVHRYPVPKFDFGEAPNYGGPPKPPAHGGNNYNRLTNGNNSDLATIYQGHSNGPPPPRKENIDAPSRAPIKLGTSNSVSGPQTYEAPQRPGNEKRKSWFGRKFGRS